MLAGVIALSGIASPFALSLGLGAAYVFGMVAPLFVISLLWERFDLRRSRLRESGWRSPPASCSRRVEGTRIVAPTARWVIRRVGYERLVLTACHPLYSAAQRIVVFARLVEPASS